MILLTSQLLTFEPCIPTKFKLFPGRFDFQIVSHLGGLDGREFLVNLGMNSQSELSLLESASTAGQESSRPAKRPRLSKRTSLGS